MIRFARTSTCVWCAVTRKCYVTTLGLLCRACCVERLGFDPEAEEWAA